MKSTPIEVGFHVAGIAIDNVDFNAALAGRLRAELQFGKIDDILAAGLHGTLTGFLADINQLGNRVSRDFLVPMAA